jgi:hypothetical protein
LSCMMSEARAPNPKEPKRDWSDRIASAPTTA